MLRHCGPHKKYKICSRKRVEVKFVSRLIKTKKAIIVIKRLQRLKRLKCLKCLKQLKQLKQLKHLKQLKSETVNIASIYKDRLINPLAKINLITLSLFWNETTTGTKYHGDL